MTRPLAGLAIAAALAACSGQNVPAAPGTDATAAEATAALDPVLAAPQVGDVYAAELTHFSGVDFSGPATGEAAYGLMRVIAVDDERITLNTETGAWPKPRGAINELRGDQAEINWDEDEKIEVYRRELPQLVADGRILEARRM
ncbi:hypothetical protein PQS31_09615 [Luteimonas sp BLCC-B24]|uniref:hypothetical protein n=1 Tax=Luteimonas sp. BLCC-B24 TaxID=3025317 RepID=UPI00234D790E|nr:hypothetical protein [Luteimonas sp. BLCC-B24]MDC7807077.1 hypothetical protein [Luteimonas sp. BLCC-B24]